jgi:hypothetical protein
VPPRPARADHLQRRSGLDAVAVRKTLQELAAAFVVRDRAV